MKNFIYDYELINLRINAYLFFLGNEEERRKAINYLFKSKECQETINYLKIDIYYYLFKVIYEYEILRFVKKYNLTNKEIIKKIKKWEY